MLIKRDLSINFASINFVAVFEPEPALKNAVNHVWIYVQIGKDAGRAVNEDRICIDARSNAGTWRYCR